MKPVIIDIRAGSELMQGYIKESLLIPLSQLLQKVPITGNDNDASNEQVKTKNSDMPYDKSSRILLVCNNGQRCEIAADVLIRNDFQHIYILKGGI